MPQEERTDNKEAVSMTTNITRRDALSLFGGAAAFAALGGLAACSGASGEKKYKIGVLQLTEHDALDAANAGFVQALDDSGISYTIDQQNAQNDQSACQTIAQKLVNDGDDLIRNRHPCRPGCGRCHDRDSHRRHGNHRLRRLRTRRLK